MTERLPSGTVTFLFSDIEGSTRLLRKLGADYASLLEDHRRLLREAFAEAGGIELGTEGDSFYIVFDSAIGAVTAAAAAQRAVAAHAWPHGVTLRVRMGLLTGEASPAADGYIGLDVHRAARLAGAAHGGQVLLSQATSALVGGGLGDGLSVLDLGEHQLKDLEGPERIYQLVISGLPSTFPPLRSIKLVPSSLPTRLTTFLGRETEIRGVLELLDSNRLVTLTGPGGTGKTRLAIEVARRLSSHYPDGVHYVDLTPIREAELVAPSIAARLGEQDRGGRSPMERLIELLRPLRVLLVLDNFEQVLPAAVQVSDLLAGAPGLRVLATSRVPLHLYGEREFPVPPLGLPEGQPRGHRADTVLSYDAVALFVERAKAAKPGFELTDENAAAVAEICARLDGLPLAIELAAARIKILPPAIVLTRLEHGLSLGGGGLDLHPRQQTLRAAIGWSHDLLDEADRLLFAGMGLFAGGATLDAAERILSERPGDAVLDGLASLVDKSLLRQVERPDGEPRFSMLETVREYAMERLSESGRLDDVQARHAAYFADLADRARPEIMGPQARQWLDALEADHDNLRAVLAWAMERGDARLCLKLSADLWRFWQRRGYLTEGLARARAALALAADDVTPELRAATLEAAGGLAYWQADAAVTRQCYEEALSLRRVIGDKVGIAEALYNLSFSYTWVTLPGEEIEAAAQHALRYLREANTLFEQVADRAGVAKTLWAIASNAFRVRDFESARSHADAAMPLLRELGDSFLTGWNLYLQGLIGLALDDLPSAGRSFREALTIFTDAQDVSAITLGLDMIAALALRLGDRERAARISGAVAGLEARSGTGLNSNNRLIVGFDPDALRRDPQLTGAWRDGEELELDDVVAYALAGGGPAGGVSGTARPDG